MNTDRLSHISICICTFRRPEYLADLLGALGRMEANDSYTCSVVVVDNDGAQSARTVTERAAERGELNLRYLTVAEQNIAMARNMAVHATTGDLVALIDDDELPSERWLSYLYETLIKYGADGVLGPVNPRFVTTPPAWVVRGRFCERPSYPTGQILDRPQQTRTGNALLRRDILIGERGPFDTRFGLTGGEDVDFFARRLSKGDTFVWCNEAAVFEAVPAERTTRSYMLRRALLRGVANGTCMSVLSAGFFKSLLALALYTSLLPVLIFARHDIFMRFLIRDFDHIGKAFATCGIRLIARRPGG